MVRIKSASAIAYLAELFCKMAAVPESIRERAAKVFKTQEG